MPRIRINASRHGAPGEVVAVEDGQVVRAGPIELVDEAGDFDALFCHLDDELQLVQPAQLRENVWQILVHAPGLLVKNASRCGGLTGREQQGLDAPVSESIAGV